MIKQQSLLAATTLCTAFFVASAEAALIERLGGLAYYDDVANLTWLADANYAQTTGYDADGLMTWAEANAWAAGLNVGGVTGWRLPEVDENCSGMWCYDSEMVNLFHGVLGNEFGINGYRITGPFSNVQDYLYWQHQEVATDTSTAWLIVWESGFKGLQAWQEKDMLNYAWAVRTGDAGVVPVPAAAWLFVSGLFVLGLGARRAS